MWQCLNASGILNCQTSPKKSRRKTSEDQLIRHRTNQEPPSDGNSPGEPFLCCFIDLAALTCRRERRAVCPWSPAEVTSLDEPFPWQGSAPAALAANP